MISQFLELVHQFSLLFLDSAPWLLLGLGIAGMIKVFVPMSWMQKQLGQEGFKTTVKAAVLGAPLPLCSCGVIPAALGLRRSGASKSATTAFLVATPETGVDSVSMTYVLLGPVMAIVRPIAAISSAIVAGLLVGTETKAKQASKRPASNGCCSKNQQADSKPKAAEKSASVFQKITKGLHYSASRLIKDTAPWLLVGLLFAALVNTFVPSDFLAKWGSGLVAMTFMVLISIPMYICATASTPIAAGLLLSGVSPGAVLVFMLAGPATNIASLGLVKSELGKRALFAYLGGVIGTAIVFGLGLDALVEQFALVIEPQVGPENRMLPLWLSFASAIVLALLMMNELVIKRFFSTPKRVEA